MENPTGCVPELTPVLFTIAIPAFKGRYLAECIESILSQTFRSFELIILNDFSTDPIKNMVASYKDDRIRFFENDCNTGAENVIDNWNKCLNYAKGEYFVLMGDDDTMQPDYLEEFLKLIKKYPDLDVYHCRANIINEQSVPYELTFSCPEYESTYNYIWHVLTSKRNQYVSDFVYRTSALISKAGFYKLPLAWSSDYITAFRASGEKGIAHHRKPLLNYRMSPYNITSTSNINLKRESILGYEKWLEGFINNDPVSEEDKILYPHIKKSFTKACRFSRIGFIRQKIGSNRFSGLFDCWTNRKKYAIDLQDIISAISISVINKI